MAATKNHQRSPEAAEFIRLPARCRARCTPPLLRSACGAAFVQRWFSARGCGLRIHAAVAATPWRSRRRRAVTSCTQIVRPSNAPLRGRLPARSYPLERLRRSPEAQKRRGKKPAAQKAQNMPEAPEKAQKRPRSPEKAGKRPRSLQKPRRSPRAQQRLGRGQKPTKGQKSRRPQAQKKAGKRSKSLEKN